MNRKERKRAAKIFRTQRKLARAEAPTESHRQSERDDFGLTPAQEAWIKLRYGLEIGSRVMWTPDAIKKERQPASREKMKRDGVGVVLRFKWWEAGPTVAVEFPGRKRPNRTWDYCRTVAYPGDLTLVR